MVDLREWYESQAPKVYCFGLLWSFFVDLGVFILFWRVKVTRWIKCYCSKHWEELIPKLFSYRYIYIFLSFFFLRFYLFIFRERGREREREKNINLWEIHGLVASHTPQTEDLAYNPDMCPESNLQPFYSQADTQSTKTHQPVQGEGGKAIWCFLVALFSLL